MRMRCKVASSHRHTHHTSINILTLFLCSFAFTCRCKTNTNKGLCSHNKGSTIPVHRNTTPAKLSQDKTRAGSAYHDWTLTSQSSLVQLTYRARESSDFKKESCDSDSFPPPVSLPSFHPAGHGTIPHSHIRTCPNCHSQINYHLIFGGTLHHNKNVHIFLQDFRFSSIYPL